MDLFSILQSPDDGTPIGQDLISEGGQKYEKTKSGILMLNSNSSSLSDSVYSSPMFQQWNLLLKERIRYYTKKQSIAGLLANWGYRSIKKFENRPKNEWLLDIGCGDGAQLAYLKDRSKYIGLDRNIERLEIMKRNFPEVTAIFGDASSLPFRPKSIKHFFSCNAFEHFWYLKDSVLEIFRCCDIDGKSIIIVPTEGGL